MKKLLFFLFILLTLTINSSAQQVPAVEENIPSLVTFGKGGEKFFDFMSQWDPWIAHLKRQPIHEDRFSENAEVFHDWLQKHEENCDVPGSDENMMTEQQRITKVNQIREKYIEWDKDLVAQLTRDFLFNHRAYYLSYLGELPRYFEMTPAERAQRNQASEPLNDH